MNLWTKHWKRTYPCFLLELLEAVFQMESVSLEKNRISINKFFAMLNWNHLFLNIKFSKYNIFYKTQAMVKKNNKERSLWFQLFYLLYFFLFVDRMSSFKSNDDYLILKNIGATSGVWNSDNRERGTVWYTLYYSSPSNFLFCFYLYWS